MYVVPYDILLGVWCLVAFLIMKQKHILRLAQKYANIVVPFLCEGLGIYVVVKSSCYRWSIKHIDASTSALPGKTVMAIVTTFVFLICITAMLWFKLRKTAPRPTLDDEHSVPRSSNECSSISDSASPEQRQA